jgi:uncharacterized membrane protein YdjX (TVP38/TMEM64 family)
MVSKTQIPETPMAGDTGPDASPSDTGLPDTGLPPGTAPPDTGRVDSGRAVKRWRRIIAAMAVVGAIVLIAAALVVDEFRLRVPIGALGENFQQVKLWVAGNPVAAVGLYVAVYLGLAVLLLPGSGLMVVLSGLFFGPWLGVPLAWASSLIAACAAFLLARRVIPGLSVLERPRLSDLRAGFLKYGLGYMLFLRFAPGLPFALVNVGPAVIGVPFRTFVIGTAVGSIPSRVALSTAGAGLAAAFDAQNAAHLQCAAAAPAGDHSCLPELDVASLLTPETVAAFLALAFLALVPAMIDGSSAIRRRLRDTPHAES